MLRTFAVGSILGGVTEVSESLAFTFSIAALDTALYGIVEYSFESMFEDQQKRAPEGTAAP
jgi:hypothetical protein